MEKTKHQVQGLEGLMGKVTGFLEIERHDRKYAPVAERVKSYREFAVPLGGAGRGRAPGPVSIWLIHESIR